MQPIQNLNGYDRPWAGGTGKNMAHVTIADGTATGVTTTNNGDGTVTFSGTPTSTAVRFVATDIALTAGVTYALSGRPQSADLPNDVWLGIYLLDSTSVISGTADRGEGSTYTPTEDVTVRLGARFPSGTTLDSVTFSPMLRIADTDPAFEPWENICPIYGHVSATAYRTGKNILPKRAARTVEANGLTVTTNADGTVLVNGTSTGAIITLRNHAQLANAGFGALAGQRLTLSGCPAGGSTSTYRIAWYNYDQPLTWSSDIGSGSTGTMMDLDANPNMSLVIRVANGTVCDNLLFKPMIRPETDTVSTYSPYTGNNYEVLFGQTVYGGTLDFVTGVLTATWKYRTLTGTESYSMSNTTYLISIARSSYDNEAKNDGQIISDRFAYTANVTGWNFGRVTISSAGIIQFTNANQYYADADSFKSWVAAQYAAGTPVQLCYELATPQTIQLDPQAITTLQGQNNIWATTTTNEP